VQDNKKTPRKRPKVTVFCFMAVLLVVGCCAFAIYRLCLRSKLNARIEAIRAAGYPMSWAELDQWYSIPEGVENAAYTFEEAFSFYKEWDRSKSASLPLFGSAELPARSEPLSEETRRIIRQFLAENKEALELLHAGAAMEHCRYAVNLSTGLMALAPHLSEIRKGVKLLELEGVSRAEDNRPVLAVNSVIDILRVADSLSREPLLTSQLSRLGSQRCAVMGLEHIVNRTELSDEQLAALSRVMIKAEDCFGMARALVGERGSLISMLKMSPAQMAHLPWLLGSARKYPSRLELNLGALRFTLQEFAGLNDGSAVICLDLMNEYIEGNKLPLHKRQKAVDAVTARLRSNSKIYLLLHMIMNEFSRMTTIELRAIAHLRTANAALAIQRYRLTTGKLVDKLADLVPEYLESVPKDPFDGEELRYKKLDPGFVVYSIGDDLSDDDGKERTSETKREAKREGKPFTWDVTFIVER